MRMRRDCRKDRGDEVSEDRILLEGMVLFGRHGTRAEEQALGQRFVVDIELRCDLREAGRTDDLTRTVDYSEVYRQARDIVEGPPFGLTEAVAERIAAAVLERHELVESVRVKVSKPNVRLDDTVLAGSAVEIIRYREAG
jgi:7,8-dihydroneopterin aldolase/epimerase/oxygenase